MTINKKDYMEFCKRVNNERGQYNDGYDLVEIETALPDKFTINTNNDVEGYFHSDEDFARFVRELATTMKTYTIGYVDKDTDHACYVDLVAANIDEAVKKVKTLKPHRIFMVREHD